MSSSTSSSNSVVNIESSEVTHTTSSSARDVSNFDHLVDQRLECPSYEWVDPRVLNIPTNFRDSNSLDKILSKIAFIKPDYPSDAVMADICGYTDRVFHGRENVSQDFFFVYNTFSQICILSFPLMILPWGSFRSSMWHQPNYTLTRGRPFKRSEFFVMFLSLSPHPNHSYFIIVPI